MHSILALLSQSLLHGRLVIFYLCLPFQLLSQDKHKIDSLLVFLQSCPEDSGKVVALNDLGDELLAIGEVEQAQEIILSAHQLSEKLNFKPGTARAKNLLGVVNIYEGNLEEAKQHLLASLVLAQEINYKPTLARVNLNLGSISADYGELDNAIAYFEKADDLYNELKDETGVGKVTLSLANLQSQLGQDNEALKNYNKVIQLADKTGLQQFAIAAYVGLGAIFSSRGNNKDALEAYSSAYAMADKNGMKFYMGAIKSNMGLLFTEEGKHKEALEAYAVSLALAEETNDKDGIATSNLNVGGTYRELGNYPVAMQYFNTALALFEEIQNVEGIIECNSGIGIVHVILGNYPEALKYFYVVEKLSRESGYKKQLANAYAEISNIYLFLKNHEEAISYSKQAIELYRQLDYAFPLTSALNNLGSIYHSSKDYKSALEVYQNALETAGVLENKSLKSSILGNIASVYIDLEQYETALPYCLESMSIKEQNGIQSGFVSGHNNLGRIYLETGKMAEAKACLDTALVVALKLGEKEHIASSYQILAHLYQREEDYKKSLENYTLYSFYRDSLINEANNKTIAELRVQHETERKDFDIRQLEKEKQINSLQLKFQEASLRQFQLEQNQARTASLLQLRQIDLLNNESKLQQARLAWNNATFETQKASIQIKQDSLNLMESKRAIDQLKLKSKTTFTNYMMVAFLLTCLLGFMAYRQYHIKQRLKLQTLRNKIANDLHDDVGSTLSSIAIFSEMAQQQSKETIPLLNTIHESSRKMLEAMADIVWTINPENDQFEKIIMRMRNFAFELLGAKQIDFEFTADEETSKLKLPMDVRKNLYLIFKEATNNMVKYSEASEAEFSIKNENDQVTMQIRDNGKGFDVNQPSSGNGIKSMRKRAEEMGADFLLKSLPGKGTLIELKIAV